VGTQGGTQSLQNRPELQLPPRPKVHPETAKLIPITSMTADLHFIRPPPAAGEAGDSDYTMGNRSFIGNDFAGVDGFPNRAGSADLCECSGCSDHGSESKRKTSEVDVTSEVFWKSAFHEQG
jgi:hypothetical protein